MKHKLLSLFVALIATTALWASNVITYTATYKLDETTYSHSSGLHTNAFNVSISSHTFSNGIGTITFNGEVTTIGDDAFKWCKGMTSITIPNSVTTIEGYAFYQCYGLTSITIPNSVTTIGNGAFYDCTGLTLVTIPNSVTTIGDYAFCICSSLTSVTIPNSVTTIGERAFRYSGLTSITIPNSVTTIGDDAFFSCSGLTSVTWNAINCAIESTSSPFRGGAEITSFTFGNEVETIPAYLCDNMTQLTSVTIPNSVKEIGELAFYHCSGLTSVTIPNSVTTIGNQAFDNGVNNIVYSGAATGSPWGAKCVNGYVDGYLVYSDAAKTKLCGCSSAAIGAITIPNSVTTIGDDAFSSCSGLTSVTIPNSVTTIGEYAFSSCSGLTSITIPNSVKEIGRYAFWYCRGLTSITIPNSVTTIESNAFQYCSGLTSPIYNANIYAYMPESYTGAYTIPNGIKQIAGGAFEGCKNLNSITIPNSVTTIEEDAFYGCSGLTSVTIPNSVTTIGNHAFYGCSGLTKTNYTGTIADWCKIQFVGNSSANPIYYSHNFFINDVEIKDLVIPEGVDKIGNYAFYNCSGLTSVTIGNSVTTIGVDAFYGCAGLTSPVYNTNCFAYMPTFYGGAYTIPDGIKQIAGGALRDCSRLISVTIPNSVTTIGWQAFYGCTNLEAVTNFSPLVFHKGSTEYGYVAYYADVVYNYTRLGDFILTSDNTLVEYVGKGGNISIPSRVSSIDAYVFANNSTITSVTIPATIRAIGNSAFKDCYNIRSITCYVQVPPSLGTNVFNGLSQYAKVYVLKSSLEDYQFALGWRDLNLFPIGAEEQPIVSDQVSVMPSTDNVILTWPANDNAAEYQLVITKDGVVFCTLKFNAQGQLIGIAFAPSRGGQAREIASAEMTASGWQFTVTGLNQASKYGYTLDALNASKQSIKHYEGEFATDGYTSLEWVTSDKIQGINKMLLGGHLYILRDGNLYTATGAKVK